MSANFLTSERSSNLLKLVEPFMKQLTFPNITTSLHKQVLRTLLYYDIFNYSLNCDEIFRFLGSGNVERSTVQACLATLKDRNLIYQFGEFYSMKNNKALIERRVKGNIEAEKFLHVARKKSMLISKFPFVRAVFASGSLSKGYMDEKSDIDFFIVTAPNRLWIARTLLVLYKRIFLFNSHKYFCVNYFVDEEDLEIEEKNLFTATELATVLPLYGAVQYENLQLANPWLKKFYPNFVLRNTADVPLGIVSSPKKLVESLINMFGGNAFERFCHKRTLARWQKLYMKDYSATDFKIAFKSKAYASKNHPSNFQKTITDLYEDKLKSYGIHDKTSDNNVYLMDQSLVLQSSRRASVTYSHIRIFTNSTRSNGDLSSRTRRWQLYLPPPLSERRVILFRSSTQICERIHPKLCRC